MQEWFKRHWRAFWQSAPENIYSFIWYGSLTALVMLSGYIGSFLISYFVPQSFVIVAIAERWKDRFIVAFVAVLIPTVATWISWLSKTRKVAPLPLSTVATEPMDISLDAVRRNIVSNLEASFRYGESKDRVPAAVAMIVEPRLGDVPFRKKVRGIVRPAGDSLQVFIEAGSATKRYWYPQEVPISVGNEWTVACTFGDDKSATGTGYRICAVSGASPITARRIDELPSDGVKSEIVTVRLNRTLPDEWTP